MDELLEPSDFSEEEPVKLPIKEGPIANHYEEKV